MTPTPDTGAKPYRHQTDPATGKYVVAGQRWRHAKTGGIYRIVAVAVDEATNRARVIYTPDDGREPKIWDREIAVFLSPGRFERLPDTAAETATVGDGFEEWWKTTENPSLDERAKLNGTARALAMMTAAMKYQARDAWSAARSAQSRELAVMRQVLQPFADAFMYLHRDPHEHEDQPDFRDFLDGNTVTPASKSKGEYLTVGDFRHAAIALGLKATEEG